MAIVILVTAIWNGWKRALLQRADIHGAWIPVVAFTVILTTIFLGIVDAFMVVALVRRAGISIPALAIQGAATRNIRVLTDEERALVFRTRVAIITVT